jgi:Uma2 family endonuclease
MGPNEKALGYQAVFDLRRGAFAPTGSGSSTRPPCPTQRAGARRRQRVCYAGRVLEPSQIAPEKPRPLKRVEYDQLVKMGVFENERVELLYGTLVAMSPQDPQHTSPIGRLTMLLAPALAGRAIVRVQCPLVACDESEPEPDFAVVPIADYGTNHPDQAYLVIEVAASSLKKDRFVKAPLYARSGISEYWLVDVVAGRIDAYRGPSSEGYDETKSYGAGQRLAIEAFPDVTILVDDVFG